MTRKLGLAISAAALIMGAAMFGTTPATAQGGVKVGLLTCYVDGGWGFVFGSSKNLRCNFSPRPNYGEHYAGTINKYGVDIGYTQSAVMVWGVIAPTANLAPGSLSGEYVGGTASATVGVGAGANVLVGGSGNSITLQPVSIEGNTGLNVAAGVGALSLHFQP